MQDKLKYEEDMAVKPLKWWQTAITWLLRIVVGGVFAYSGFVKGIDPWGTLYKVQDYLAAMDFSWVDPSVALTGVFLLFTLEFLTGVFLLTGSFRRFAPVMTLLFMLVMLPLTLWIAVKEPVADCGCFGDAWIISNWATFWKNVAITLGGIWLLIYNRRTHWLITPALQWVGFLASGVYVVAVGLTGYIVQPLIDFREYKTGGPLVTADASSLTPHFEFIYEKNGERKTFAETDELPDESEGWQFVDRREIPAAKPSSAAPQRALRAYDPATDEDLTGDISGSKGVRQLVLLMPSLEDVGVASTWKINSLKEWADAHDVDFFAITSGTKEEVDAWADLSLADYSIYTADDTAIKEVARGNPAIVYVADNEIRWKSTLRALRGDDFMAADTTSDAMQLNMNLDREAKGITAVYVCVLGVLMMLSFIPKMFRRGFRPLRRLRAGSVEAVSDDDTARREE